MTLAGSLLDGGGLYTIVMLVALFAVMYFMMIRPQQKETKRKNAIRSSN